MGTALALAALALIVILVWAAWVRRGAAAASKRAALPKGDLVSIDASDPSEDLAHLVQQNLYSARYGVSGGPDRVIRNRSGYAPVELKNAPCPRSGPHPREIAQVAVYCLLLEEHFQCTVEEGILRYTDREMSVPFDKHLRRWTLKTIEEVRQANNRDAMPQRSYDHATRCRACSYFEYCREALRRVSAGTILAEHRDSEQIAGGCLKLAGFTPGKARRKEATFPTSLAVRLL